MSYELEIDLKRIYNYFLSLKNFFKIFVLLNIRWIEAGNTNLQNIEIDRFDLRFRIQTEEINRKWTLY